MITGLRLRWGIARGLRRTRKALDGAEASWNAFEAEAREAHEAGEASSPKGGASEPAEATDHAPLEAGGLPARPAASATKGTVEMTVKGARQSLLDAALADCVRLCQIVAALHRDSAELQRSIRVVPQETSSQASKVPFRGERDSVGEGDEAHAVLSLAATPDEASFTSSSGASEAADAMAAPIWRLLAPGEGDRVFRVVLAGLFLATSSSVIRRPARVLHLSEATAPQQSSVITTHMCLPMLCSGLSLVLTCREVQLGLGSRDWPEGDALLQRAGPPTCDRALLDHFGCRAWCLARAFHRALSACLVPSTTPTPSETAVEEATARPDTDASKRSRASTAPLPSSVVRRISAASSSSSHPVEPAIPPGNDRLETMQGVCELLIGVLSALPSSRSRGWIPRPASWFFAALPIEPMPHREGDALASALAAVGTPSILSRLCSSASVGQAALYKTASIASRSLLTHPGLFDRASRASSLAPEPSVEDRPLAQRLLSCPLEAVPSLCNELPDTVSLELGQSLHAAWNDYFHGRSTSFDESKAWSMQVLEWSSRLAEDDSLRELLRGSVQPLVQHLANQSSADLVRLLEHVEGSCSVPVQQEWREVFRGALASPDGGAFCSVAWTSSPTISPGAVLATKESLSSWPLRSEGYRIALWVRIPLRVRSLVAAGTPCAIPLACVLDDGVDLRPPETVLSVVWRSLSPDSACVELGMGGGSDVVSISIPPGLPPSPWLHLQVQHSATEACVFVNGELAGAQTVAGAEGGALPYPCMLAHWTLVVGACPVPPCDETRLSAPVASICCLRGTVDPVTAAREYSIVQAIACTRRWDRKQCLLASPSTASSKFFAWRAIDELPDTGRPASEPAVPECAAVLRKGRPDAVIALPPLLTAAAPSVTGACFPLAFPLEMLVQIPQWHAWFAPNARTVSHPPSEESRSLALRDVDETMRGASTAEAAVSVRQCIARAARQHLGSQSWRFEQLLRDAADLGKARSLSILAGGAELREFVSSASPSVRREASRLLGAVSQALQMAVAKGITFRGSSPLEVLSTPWIEECNAVTGAILELTNPLAALTLPPPLSRRLTAAYPTEVSATDPIVWAMLGRSPSAFSQGGASMCAPRTILTAAKRLMRAIEVTPCQGVRHRAEPILPPPPTETVDAEKLFSCALKAAEAVERQVIEAGGVNGNRPPHRPTKFDGAAIAMSVSSTFLAWVASQSASLRTSLRMAGVPGTDQLWDVWQPQGAAASLGRDVWEQDLLAVSLGEFSWPVRVEPAWVAAMRFVGVPTSRQAQLLATAVGCEGCGLPVQRTLRGQCEVPLRDRLAECLDADSSDQDALGCSVLLGADTVEHWLSWLLPPAPVGAGVTPPLPPPNSECRSALVRAIGQSLLLLLHGAGQGLPAEGVPPPHPAARVLSSPSPLVDSVIRDVVSAIVTACVPSASPLTAQAASFVDGLSKRTRDVIGPRKDDSTSEPASPSTARRSSPSGSESVDDDTAILDALYRKLEAARSSAEDDSASGPASTDRRFWWWRMVLPEGSVTGKVSKLVMEYAQSLWARRRLAAGVELAEWLVHEADSPRGDVLLGALVRALSQWGTDLSDELDQAVSEATRLARLDGAIRFPLSLLASPSERGRLAGLRLLLRIMLLGEREAPDRSPSTLLFGVPRDSGAVEVGTALETTPKVLHEALGCAKDALARVTAVQSAATKAVVAATTLRVALKRQTTDSLSARAKRLSVQTQMGEMQHEVAECLASARSATLSAKGKRAESSEDARVCADVLPSMLEMELLEQFLASNTVTEAPAPVPSSAASASSVGGSTDDGKGLPSPFQRPLSVGSAVASTPPGGNFSGVFRRIAASAYAIAAATASSLGLSQGVEEDDSLIGPPPLPPKAALPPPAPQAVALSHPAAGSEEQPRPERRKRAFSAEQEAPSHHSRHSSIGSRLSDMSETSFHELHRPGSPNSVASYLSDDAHEYGIEAEEHHHLLHEVDTPASTAVVNHHRLSMTPTRLVDGTHRSQDVVGLDRSLSWWFPLDRSKGVAPPRGGSDPVAEFGALDPLTLAGAGLFVAVERALLACPLSDTLIAAVLDAVSGVRSIRPSWARPGRAWGVRGRRALWAVSDPYDSFWDPFVFALAASGSKLLSVTSSAVADAPEEDPKWLWLLRARDEWGLGRSPGQWQSGSASQWEEHVAKQVYLALLQASALSRAGAAQQAAGVVQFCKLGVAALEACVAGSPVKDSAVHTFGSRPGGESFGGSIVRWESKDLSVCEHGTPIAIRWHWFAEIAAKLAVATPLSRASSRVWAELERSLDGSRCKWAERNATALLLFPPIGRGGARPILQACADMQVSLTSASEAAVMAMTRERRSLTRRGGTDGASSAGNLSPGPVPTSPDHEIPSTLIREGSSGSFFPVTASTAECSTTAGSVSVLIDPFPRSLTTKARVRTLASAAAAGAAAGAAARVMRRDPGVAVELISREAPEDVAGMRRRLQRTRKADSVARVLQARTQTPAQGLPGVGSSSMDLLQPQSSLSIRLGAGGSRELLGATLLSLRGAESGKASFTISGPPNDWGTVPVSDGDALVWIHPCPWSLGWCQTGPWESSVGFAIPEWIREELLDRASSHISPVFPLHPFFPILETIADADSPAKTTAVLPEVALAADRGCVWGARALRDLSSAPSARVHAERTPSSDFGWSVRRTLSEELARPPVQWSTSAEPHKPQAALSPTGLEEELLSTPDLPAHDQPESEEFDALRPGSRSVDEDTPDDDIAHLAAKEVARSSARSLRGDIPSHMSLARGSIDSTGVGSIDSGRHFPTGSVGLSVEPELFVSTDADGPRWTTAASSRLEESGQPPLPEGSVASSEVSGPLSVRAAAMMSSDMLRTRIAEAARSTLLRMKRLRGRLLRQALRFVPGEEARAVWQLLAEGYIDPEARVHALTDLFNEFEERARIPNEEGPRILVAIASILDSVVSPPTGAYASKAQHAATEEGLLLSSLARWERQQWQRAFVKREQLWERGELSEESMPDEALGMDGGTWWKDWEELSGASVVAAASVGAQPIWVPGQALSDRFAVRGMLVASVPPLAPLPLSSRALGGIRRLAPRAVWGALIAPSLAARIVTVLNSMATKNATATRSLMRRCGVFGARDALVRHCIHASTATLDESAEAIAALEPSFEVIAAAGELPRIGGIPRLICLFLLAGDTGFESLQSAIASILFIVAGSCDASREAIAKILHHRRVLVAFAKSSGMPTNMMLSAPQVQDVAEAREEARKARRRGTHEEIDAAAKGKGREPLSSRSLVAGDTIGFCRWFNRDSQLDDIRPTIWSRSEQALVEVLRSDDASAMGLSEALHEAMTRELDAEAASRSLRGIQWWRGAVSVDQFVLKAFEHDLSRRSAHSVAEALARAEISAFHGGHL
jgi:hypothetical protein